MRLLLSGCGTPIQPLSKVVQLSISHLTQHLPYQIIDTKEFLQKVQHINQTLAPIPESACFAVCDVISLYPNVNNDMGVPATEQRLRAHPSPLNISPECVVEALKLTLNNNVTAFTDGEGHTTYAKPNHGTAMGPSHACDYVDIFMGELDEMIVNQSPIPLLSSLAPTNSATDLKSLDWSRFRDDGFTIIPDESYVDRFEQHLQALHPPTIRWTVSHGKTANYLDVSLELKDGRITTDVFSKHCHSYLPPTSCHSPGVFKGLIRGVGTRLRMICSDDDTLAGRVDEYTNYFAASGWKKTKARSELQIGAGRNRAEILSQPRMKKTKKLAWVTTYDPRLPSKSAIIRKNLPLLYSSQQNRQIFPNKLLIGAGRRRKNFTNPPHPDVLYNMAQNNSRGFSHAKPNAVTHVPIPQNSTTSSHHGMAGNGL